MKRWIIVFLLVVGLAIMSIILAGCSQMEKGVVVSRIHTPESGYWSSMCTAYNKAMQCTFSVPIYQTIPESFEFYLRDGDNEGYRDVTREEYNGYGIGESYP